MKDKAGKISLHFLSSFKYIYYKNNEHLFK